MMIEANGIALHYDVHGDGEWLLWLHGGMGHGADWTFIFGAPPPGCRLLAPDLRGHGRSTGEHAVAYSFRQSALDMFTLMDALEIDAIKIIGLSGGGISALHMATLQPDRVSAMVVVSAPAVFPEQARRIQRRFSEKTLGESEMARMRERHRRPGRLDALSAQIRAMADGGDPNFTAEDLARITARTLVVFGDQDFLYPAVIGAELADAIPGASLWLVTGGSHGPVFGDRAPAFVQRALRFLATKSRAGDSKIGLGSDLWYSICCETQNARTRPVPL